MKLELKKKLFSKKKIRSLCGRLGIALVALSLVAVLILWDSGIIDLPFLIRSERREPVTQTEEETETTILEYIDYGAYAEKLLFSVYNASAVSGGALKYSTAQFDKNTMSIVKSELVGEDYETAYGFLLKNEGGSVKSFALPSLEALAEGKNFTFTGLLDRKNSPVFQKKDDQGYYVWNGEEKAFVSTDFDPKRDDRGVDFLVPASYGAENETHFLVYENGLFGYKGSYKDGRKTKNFTVDAVYPAAYSYSEGFAVMADENGVVTIRNEKGEPVFEHLSLLMTEKSGEEALGFHYFDDGLLRVVFASYDENGALKSKREGIINQYGNEVTLPQGYQAVSYLEGVFVVTDGEKYGYVSSDGAWIGAPVFYDAEPFSEGLAVVSNADGKKGLIDKNGKIVLDMAFEGISSFSGGFSVLYSKENGWFLLSKVEGVYPPQADEVPSSSSFHTKVTITRNPENSTDFEEDIVVTFPPILSTPSRTTHPEFFS